MKLGVQYQWDPEVLPVEAAHYAERLGFESIWMGEHSHIPVRRETPFPGGGEIPDGYHRIPDPFVCLGAISATTGLRLGLAVLLLPMRDPISTAKEIATLDAISGGRVEVGVGVGWLVEQMRNHGVHGDDEALLRLVHAYGAHALTLDHLGGLIGQFLGGDPEKAPEAPKPPRPGEFTRKIW